MQQRRALAIFAHPDDVDFSAAGTVAVWVEEGWDVRYVVVTSGQKGGQDAEVTAQEFGALRQDEQRAAAKAVGVTDVTFLDYMDSEVFDTLELRRDLARQFRRHRPHRLLTMDPQPLPTESFINHPDHRAVGQAALDMTVSGGTTAQIFPELLTAEGLPPWQELEETWIAGPGGGPVAVDITATVDRKFAALAAHASQLDGQDVRSWLAPRLADTGRPHGYGYAESFRVISYRR